VLGSLAKEDKTAEQLAESGFSLGGGASQQEEEDVMLETLLAAEEVKEPQEPEGFDVPFTPGPLLKHFGAREDTSPFGGITLAPHAQEWFGQEKIFAPDEGTSIQDAGSTKVAAGALDKIKEVRAAAEAAEADEIAAANAMQSSLDPYSWLGGEGGEDPAGKLEKLRKIREQAGSTPGGGTFSQQADSPELQARIADREAWVAEGPERDLAFLASAEQARRNPELAMSAAEQLKGLRAQKTLDRQVANQEALIEAVKNTGGKVPFEIANQLDVAGFDVPWPMRGLSPDRAKENINSVVMNATKDIQNPMTPIEDVQYLEWVVALASKYQQMIDVGMDPDEAWNKYDALVRQGAAESGAI
jgi:hypothetical protein